MKPKGDMTALNFYLTKSWFGNRNPDLVTKKEYLVMQTNLVIQNEISLSKMKFRNPKYKFGNKPKIQICSKSAGLS